MKAIEDLLKQLARPEVLEFGLVTNRLPSVNIGGKFEPVDDEAPTTDKLLQMLVTMGGSRYVDSLSDKPVQWTTRLDGVGVIAVAAIMRKDVVQARFTVARRDPLGTGGSSSKQLAVAPSGPNQTAPPQPAGQQRPSTREAAAAPQASPVAAQARQQPPAIKKTEPQPARSPAATAPTPAPSPTPLQGAVPPPDDFDDDDEPTVQTLSPPVAQPGPSSDPRPKPARKTGADAPRTERVPEAEAKAAAAAAQEKAAAEKAAAEKAAAEKATAEKAAAEKAVAEKAAATKAAAEKAAAEKAAAEKAAAEKAAAEKAAAEKAAAEQAAAEQAAAEKAASEKAASEKAASEKAAAEKAAAEQAAAEQAAAEKAAAEKAAADKAAAERAQPVVQRGFGSSAAQPTQTPVNPGEPRRINTPTSVDAVDVEITTSDGGGRALSLDLDPDEREQTVEMAPVMVAPAQIKAVTGAMPSAVPSTSPSAGALPEKERPQPTRDSGLDAFLHMAHAARATDLHIIASRPLMLRVATDLLPRTQPVPPELIERIVREVVPPRLRDALDREGACDFALDAGEQGRYRVNVSRQRTGFKIAMRVISRETPTLASLGLPPATAGATTHQHGLVLVTGPSSSGKTSTLAALVDQINRETAHHIVVIEDPVEHIHPRKRAIISQREVGTSARSVSIALRTALREDPDVVVVGELRDPDAVRHALAAAETGHLVMATMNTPSAAKAIDRLIDLFPTTEQPQVRVSVAATLKMIIGQRLVPSADRTRLHAAVEILPASLQLYTLIRDARTFQIPSLQQRGRGQGVVRLDESLAELVRQQKVTLEVAKQYADSPPDLEALAARGAPSMSRKA